MLRFAAVRTVLLEFEQAIRPAGEPARSGLLSAR